MTSVMAPWRRKRRNSAASNNSTSSAVATAATTVAASSGQPKEKGAMACAPPGPVAPNTIKAVSAK